MGPIGRATDSVTSPEELIGERKNVTVLFADIVDSTRLFSALDSEDAATLLATTISRLERIAQDYGGAIPEHLGDGLMAVFGAPQAVENHAALACHAALEMQAVVRGQVARTFGTAPIAIRVGINTGESVLQATAGPDYAKGFNVLGFTVHLASRFQSLAEPGAIYIGESTYLALHDAFRCVPLGPRTIKGVEAPARVYALIAARPWRRPRFGLEHFDVAVPFVGRARELGVLSDALERARQGEGAVVSICGEAGVGKSRLLAEARQQVGDTGLQWLECAGLSFGRSISFLPLLQLLRASVGTEEGDDAATVRTRMSALVRELFRETSEEVLPYLLAFMGLELDDDQKQRVEYLDGDAMAPQIRRCLRLFFQNLARRQPLVLVFEDFYWFDDSSIALVEHLLPLAETEPIVICIIGRGEADAADIRIRTRAAGDHPRRYRELALKPLPDADSGALIRRLLHDDADSARLHEAILHKAEGNPLFIEETIRGLIETGALRPAASHGAYQLASDLATIRIPDTVQDVIMARVDRLNDQVKQVLLTASVIGRSFLYRILRAIAERAEELDDYLANLERLEFIDEQRQYPDIEYMFRHAVIQEVTYNSILRNRRRQLHQRIGEALETIFPDRLEEFSGVLAYHFGHAEDWGRAQRYLMLAGEKADRLAADGEALQHFRQAVEACVRVFGDRIDPTLRINLDVKLGEAHFRRGEHDAAERHFKQALKQLSPHHINRIRHVKLSIARELAIQTWHALRTGKASSFAGTPNVETVIEAEIYRMLGWMAYFDDPERLLLYSLLLLNVCERQAHARGVALASSSIGYACDVLGAERFATHYHNQAGRAAERAANPIALATSRLCFAWHHAYGGRWDDALQLFGESAEIAWRAGDLKVWGSAAWGRIVLFCHRGALGDASRMAEWMQAVGLVSAEQVMLRWARLGRGMILARLGKLDQAETELSAALDLARAARDLMLLPHAASELGRCLLTQGRLAEASEILDSADRRVRACHLRGHHVVLMRQAMMELRLAEARRAGDPGGRRRALARARRTGRHALRAAQTYRGALPEALRLRGVWLWEAGRNRDAEECWRQSLDEAEHLGARYESALTLLAAGEHTGKAAQIEGGETLLCELRAGTAV